VWKEIKHFSHEYKKACGNVYSKPTHRLWFVLNLLSREILPDTSFIFAEIFDIVSSRSTLSPVLIISFSRISMCACSVSKFTIEHCRGFKFWKSIIQSRYNLCQYIAMINSKPPAFHLKCTCILVGFVCQKAVVLGPCRRQQTSEYIIGECSVARQFIRPNLALRPSIKDPCSVWPIRFAAGSAEGFKSRIITFLERLINIALDLDKV